MSYNLQYTSEYYDIAGTQHWIDIYGLDYVGTPVVIENSGDTPVTMRHGGGDKHAFESIIIQGQELQYNFYIPRDQVSTFNPLFESDYKDFKIKYYVGSHTEDHLEFTGWIDPENLTKEYSTNPPFVEINLSANDGLSALKSIEFRNTDDTLINQKLTILQILKIALAKTGIELDFMIQLGTYETTGMTSTQCALSNIYIDTKCLVGSMLKTSMGFNMIGFNEHGPDSQTVVYRDTITGVKDPMDCWGVIETVLLDFNVQLKQYKNKYYITNKYEVNSYVFNFDFATLTQQSRTATNNIVDISNFKYKIGIEQQKVKPLKEVNITFKNKDLGGDLTGVDLNNWNEGVVWHADIPMYPTGASYPKGYGLPVNGTDHFTYTLVSDFSVTKITDNDYIKVKFDSYFLLPAIQVFIAAQEPTAVIVGIKHPDGVYQYGPLTMISQKEKSIESPLFGAFKISSTGNYNIEILVVTTNQTHNWVWDDEEPYAYAIFGIGNVAISKVVDASETEQSDLVTFDRHYTQTLNRSTASYTIETILADSNQVSEIGSYLYYSGGHYHNTHAWNSYGRTEAIKILDIYSRNILNNRYSYKDYLRCSVIDRLNAIGFDNILEIDSKIYSILSYTRNFKLGELQLQLIELLTDYKGYGDIYEVIGESINGTSTTSSSTNVAPSGGTTHNSLSGLQGGGSSSFYHLPPALYTDLLDVDALSIDSTNHRIGIGNVAPTYKLDVNGTGRFVNDVRIEGSIIPSVGSTSAYGINFPANPGGGTNDIAFIRYFVDAGEVTRLRIGIANEADDRIAFWQLGADRMSIYNGCVGIGTDSPYEKLEVNGGISSIGTSLTSAAQGPAITMYYHASGYGILQGVDWGNSYKNIVLQLGGGNVGIGINSTGYKLHVSGTGYFTDALYAGSNVGSTVYSSGFAGSGWRLTNGGGDVSLTVDNLVVRKAMTVYELDINQINSINGGLIVSAANGKCLTVSGTTIYFDEDGGSKLIQFQVHDYIRAQIWTGRGVSVYVGYVTAVHHSDTYGSANIVATTVSGTPWNGMELVQIGNDNDTNRQSLIYITASDTNNPYIDMLSGVNAGSFAGKQRLRIGNLTGITDTAFGGALSGYGLYADNVYLRGKMMLVDSVGVNLIHPELWVVGTSGDQPPSPNLRYFSDLNGGNIIQGTGADSEPALMWETPYAPYGYEVGWVALGRSDASEVIYTDKNKSYRFSYYLRTTSATGIHQANSGTNLTLDLNDSETSIFFNQTLSINTWYFVVCYIYSSTYNGPTTSRGGVFECTTGQKIVTCVDLKWGPVRTMYAKPTNKMTGGVSGDKQYSYAPRFEIIDGSEPKLQSYLGIYTPPPTGTGLFVDATHMGYYAASAWKTYIDNAGNMILGNYAGGGAGLSWSQSGATLSIKGAITATSGLIGDWAINSAYLAKDTGTDATSAGMSPTDYPFYAGATYANRATAPFRVTNAGAVTMTNGTFTGTFKTAASGKRIAMSNSTNDMFFYSSYGDYVNIGGTINSCFIDVLTPGGRKTRLTPGTLQVTDQGAQNFQMHTLLDNLTFILEGLPTGPTGLPVNTVWRDEPYGGAQSSYLMIVNYTV